MSWENPFAPKQFDPLSGRMSDREKPPQGQGMYAAPDGPERPEHDTEYDWDNLNSQERALWASVFGVAYNYAVTSGNSETAYKYAVGRSRTAIAEHRRR